MAEKIMAAMDPKCRHLMKLKFLLCWSDQEIADSIRKTKNATSTAMTRCLKKAQELEFVREAQ
jgi:DNA-directed RNA polymerase specialized sigma24 family protein